MCWVKEQGSLDVKGLLRPKAEKVLLNWEAGGGLLADGGKRRTVVVMGG